MIRLAARNALSAVQLFEQHDARKVMRQRDGAERKRLVGAATHGPIHNDFMAEDRVRSELSGIVKNVEIMNGEWDGEAYTITGRIKLPPVRAVVAPKIPFDKTYEEPKPKKSSTTDRKSVV